jgi:hypothetical protein
MVIECDPDYVVRVLSAFYGSQIDNTCFLNATTIVQAFCDQKQYCNFTSGNFNGIYSDPCPGEPKHATYSWTCVGKGMCLIWIIYFICC